MTKTKGVLISADKTSSVKRSLHGAFTYFFAVWVYSFRGDIMSKNFGVQSGNSANDRIPFELEKPIRAGLYPVIDTDLARDNLENDIPAADLQDL